VFRSSDVAGPLLGLWNIRVLCRTAVENGPAIDAKEKLTHPQPDSDNPLGLLVNIYQQKRQHWASNGRSNPNEYWTPVS